MRCLLLDGDSWVETPRPRAIPSHYPRIGLGGSPARQGGKPRSLAMDLLQCLRSGTAEGYNRALTLYSQNQEELGGILRYLRHVQPMSPQEYPCHSHTARAQAYLINEGSPAPIILACFTGGGCQLNMPVACFHSIARHFFDCVAYFFDPTFSLYTYILSELSRSLEALALGLGSERICLLGTSAGANAALRIRLATPIQRRCAFSPILTKDPSLLQQIEAWDFSAFRHSKIFFSISDNTDAEQYNCLKQRMPGSMLSQVVVNVDPLGISHGTLGTITAAGKLPPVLGWLRGA